MKKIGLLTMLCIALLNIAVVFMSQTVVFAHADNGYEAKEYMIIN